MSKQEHGILEIITEIMSQKSRIFEMSGDNEQINVPVNPRIDISTITADDPNPMFVNLEILRAGISSNNRRYSNFIVGEVNDLVPGLQCFLGHPDPNKYGFEFREPHGIFVGSVVETMADGLARSIGKVYIFRTSPLREWVPKSIAAGNPMTVSINGSADIVRNGDVIDVLHMTELQSIDWANPGTEGMGTSKALNIVNEMNNNKNGGNQMDGKEIIQNVTVAELRAYNSDACNAILKATTITELQAQNPELVNQIKETGKITEMNLSVDGQSKMVKITEIQSVIDGYETQIKELKDKAVKAELDAYKTSKITELVSEEYREKISKRVVGDTKEAIDKSINDEIAYVREMGGFNNLPGGKYQHGTTDSLKESVANMFGVKKENK